MKALDKWGGHGRKNKNENGIYARTCPVKRPARHGPRAPLAPKFLLPTRQTPSPGTEVSTNGAG